MASQIPSQFSKTSVADQNVRSFLLFRIFFNARFYYPVLAVLFLDLGLSLEQYALLNVAWAAAIVLMEVPSGALADLIGRKKLVVTASFLMVLEMLIFAFAPTDNVQLLFWIFFLNRIFSGAAEACASGADEALVYDSLKNENREVEWTLVLDRLNKYMAVSFFVVMIIGAAVYDAKFLNGAANIFGLQLEFKSSDLVRVPIYLTLLSSLVTCFSTLRMVEVRPESHRQPSVREAFREVFASGHWIWKSPVAFFVILAALSNDCFLRLFMTFTSNYFRLIHLPEISFGLIGAALGLVGYLAPAIAKKFIGLGSAWRAYGALSLFTFVSLAALPLAITWIGLFFVFIIGTSMGVLGFLTSYYLNAVAETSRRATILSFKGLASNLAYGGIGIFFAALLKNVQASHPEATENIVFNKALIWLPGSFLVVIGVAYLFSKLNQNRRFMR